MKEKRNIKKFLLATTIVAASMFTILGTNSQAALQSNYATHTSKDVEQIEKAGSVWIQEIREMETAGQTMGLTETLNADLTPTTSNGIDVHMMKTTEYGAVAILSVSGFGWGGMLKDAPIKSTTGNVTGVYFTGDREEWTAGVCQDSTVGKDKRYYDLYIKNDQTSAKVGDALGLDTYKDNPGCYEWHGEPYCGWLRYDNRGFLRGFGGIFGFNGDGNDTIWTRIDQRGRGVAVVGANL